MSKAWRMNWMLLVLCLLISLVSAGAAVASSQERVTIIDYTGKSMEVPSPVETVISLSSHASEILCALEGGDKIIGRGASSTFPPYLEDVPVVGESSYTPNIELILELDPDVVIADTMLSDDGREKIESAGIPVIVDRFSDPDRTIANIRNLGLILGKEERGEELADFIENYHSIIEERILDLEEKDKPVVLCEWGSPWKVATPGTSYGNKIMAAGGTSIAADETPGKYVVVSSEWVAERNPDIIVFQVFGKVPPTAEELEETRNEILSRPGLSEVKAVKDERVYIITSGIVGGAPSVIGDLYLAKWFHPDLFEDIDPEAVHGELLQKFLGLELEDVYVYP
jgi:iron complex transport system substrate-binding protein